MAIAAAALVLVTAVSPHAHDGAQGRHDCPACVTSSGAVAVHETPDIAPIAVWFEPLPPLSGGVAAPGFPAGAPRGQSPPWA